MRSKSTSKVTKISCKCLWLCVWAHLGTPASVGFSGRVSTVGRSCGRGKATLYPSESREKPEGRAAGLHRAGPGRGRAPPSAREAGVRLPCTQSVRSAHQQPVVAQRPQWHRGSRPSVVSVACSCRPSMAARLLHGSLRVLGARRVLRAPLIAR
jgi:hypothetical protein